MVRDGSFEDLDIENYSTELELPALVNEGCSYRPIVWSCLQFYGAFQRLKKGVIFKNCATHHLTTKIIGGRESMWIYQSVHGIARYNNHAAFDINKIAELNELLIYPNTYFEFGRRIISTWWYLR